MNNWYTIFDEHETPVMHYESTSNAVVIGQVMTVAMMFTCILYLHKCKSTFSCSQHVESGLPVAGNRNRSFCGAQDAYSRPSIMMMSGESRTIGAHRVRFSLRKRRTICVIGRRWRAKGSSFLEGFGSAPANSFANHIQFIIMLIVICSNYRILLAEKMERKGDWVAELQGKKRAINREMGWKSLVCYRLWSAKWTMHTQSELITEKKQLLHHMNMLFPAHSQWMFQ